MSDNQKTPTINVRYELPNDATEAEKRQAARAAIYTLFQKELAALRELRAASSLVEADNRDVDMNLDAADGILAELSERMERGLSENEISAVYREVRSLFDRAKARLDFDRQKAIKSKGGASKGGKKGKKTKQDANAPRNHNIRRAADQMYMEGHQEKAVVSKLSERFTKDDGTNLSARQIRRILNSQ
ncbi:MAG: hypothetical protein RID42_17225 [Alphaproteobacteria bacterium]